MLLALALLFPSLMEICHSSEVVWVVAAAEVCVESATQRAAVPGM